ncbi:MAG: SDR family NAD(P)-dependent oxidoreductase [Alphaproteobacteria bacterium]|nr:SDR family NAD(P)-dependent oxidoreductase [Alphaproteobacteria bacterium]
MTVDPTALVVFVTGATSGFGDAIARLFVRSGARVIASGRRTDRLLALKRELATDRLLTVELDVRDESAVNKLLAPDALPAPFSTINVLVNNAGLALGLEPAHAVAIGDWKTMIDTNINGLIYVTRALLPGMVARKRGHIINLGSVAGSYPYPGGNVYGGTKAFVHQFSLALRSDLLGHNVRVTCVEPGMAETEFAETRFKGDKDKAKAVYKGMKSVSAAEIAEIIRYIATLPEHVNVNTIEIMPTSQAFAPFAVHRRE